MASSKQRSVLANQDGMALLITIMTLAVLVVVTVQYSRDNWHELLVSHNYKTRNQLKMVAESGINLGVAILQQDSNEEDFDSLLDNWAQAPSTNFNALFDNTELEVTIEDLSGKIQINRLGATNSKDGNNNNSNDENDENDENQEQNGDGEREQEQIKQLLVNLLLSENFAIEEDREAIEIVDALVDWIDEDDDESDQGAENSYYQSLKIPYSCRNGPVQNVEELLLVKGINYGILFGIPGKSGLADFVTVYGDDGKLNINTANSIVIRAFDPLISEELVEDFHAFRTDEQNKDQLSQITWYKNIGGWPGDVVLNDNLINVKSIFFKIKAVAKLDEITVQIAADVERSGKDAVNILGRLME